MFPWPIMIRKDSRRLPALLVFVGFTGFGFYPRQNFMHIDIGRARQWGERFPRRASRFAPKPPRLRETLTESRTMKGGGAAGVATIYARWDDWRKRRRWWVRCSHGSPSPSQ